MAGSANAGAGFAGPSRQASEGGGGALRSGTLRAGHCKTGGGGIAAAPTRE
jgi:hypothetical protein